jgi:hypothetical protein
MAAVTARLSVLSTMLVRVYVGVTDDDGAPVDPTTGPVKLAFIPGSRDPVTADWHDAAWGPTKPGAALPYPAQLLVGDDGGIVLDKGRYRPWVDFTAGDERIVEAAAGWLLIT